MIIPISVLFECKRLGIKTNKDGSSTVDNKSIGVQIQHVMDFFFLGKANQGKIFKKKSKSKVVAGKLSTETCDSIENIEQFCDQRIEEGPIVISCDDDVFKELCGSMSEPHYVLSSNDLNSCSFSKELGKIILQDKCNIFMATSDLSKLGKERVINIVKKMKFLFDNRIRVILYGVDCMEAFSERRFTKPAALSEASVEQLSSSRKRKSSEFVSHQDKINSVNFPKEVIDIELLKTKESLAKALNNKTESDCKIRDLMAENELLKTNIRDSLLVHRATEKALKRDNCTLTEKLKSVEAVKAEVIEEKLDSDKRVKSLIEENKSLRNKMVEMKKVNKSQVDNLEIENKLWSEKVQGMEEEINYFQERSTNSIKDNDGHEVVTESSPELRKSVNKDVGCQTRKVDISISNISSLFSKIKENRSHSTSAKVSACIKNFACSIQNTPDGNGGYCCKVEITNGKTIMVYPDILNFEGRGASMSDAKETAFETFLSLMKIEAEK